MANVLDKITDRTREDLLKQIDKKSLQEIELEAKSSDSPRGFIDALTCAAAVGPALIAEIKKASPSKGLIRADFDPPAIANAYENAGAACISVLTDEPFFQGSADYLIAAREAVQLPVLRKDFMIDPYQVPEARAMGADCILLIMAALDDGLARELEASAHDWGMDVLIEVHNGEELDRALKLKSPLIGVNNRDLTTLEVSLETTVSLAARVPEDRILVSESGLYTAEDLSRMAKAGAKAFLIGESLMRQADVETATRTLLQSAREAA